MKLKLIGCKVMMRELYLLCAKSEHVVDIVWMEAALHENPKQLKGAIQRTIDAIEDDPNADCEAILLGFGLCAMGTVGLRTKRFPLIAPRAHDCITMLLGSRDAYQELFDRYDGGVYWYSPGWIEQFKTAGRGYGEQEKYMDYVEKYGEDNAQYLIEVERGWTQNYTCAALIQWPEFKDNPFYAAETQKAAANSALEYIEVEGRESLLSKLVNGQWGDGDILTVLPGQVLAYSGDESIIRAEDAG